MCAERMIFPTSILIGETSLFRRVKQTQTNGFVINLDLGQPTLIFCAHARVTAFVVAAFVAVMRVLNVSRFAQIAKTIIRSIAINVVDLMRWPCVRYIQPSQTMRKVKHIIKPNYDIPVFHSATNFSALRAPTPFDAPCKHSRFRIVVDKITDAICFNLILHDTVNINCWRECQA